MESIFFLVLVGVVGLLRWLAQAAENKKNAAPPQSASSAPSVQREQQETEEERVRKFFEALGVPPSSTPTPPRPRQVTPRTPPRKRPIMPVDPFPAPRGGMPTPPIVVKPAPAAPLPPPVPTNVIKAAKPPRAAAVFEVREGGEVERESVPPAVARTTTAVAPAQSWAARLATPAGLRDAVVLREIFGPPRSLQPFDVQSLG